MRLAAALAAAAALAGCGGDGDRLVVSAASSLKSAFTAYADDFDADVALQFAGSDELAAQIERGVRPDVFAAANATLPQQLYERGLVERPRVFAGNRLVLAVPAGETAIDALGDLRAPGTTLAIGVEGVPVGDYTRAVLEGLDGELRRAILANVRSEEPDVAGVVGKLTQGAVDAGFVYTSDVRAAGGRLRAVELPPPLDPDVAYAAAVLEDAPHPEAAARFVDGLVSGAGQDALQAAGFEPPR